MRVLLFLDGLSSLVFGLSQQGSLTTSGNAVFEKGEWVPAFLLQGISPVFVRPGIGDRGFEDGQGLLAKHQAGGPGPVWKHPHLRVASRLKDAEEVLNQLLGLRLGAEGVALHRRLKWCIEWTGRARGARAAGRGTRLMREIYFRLNRYITQREILLLACVIIMVWIKLVLIHALMMRLTSKVHATRFTLHITLHRRRLF
jgi:hypothetical protein